MFIALHIEHPSPFGGAELVRTIASMNYPLLRTAIENVIGDDL